MLFFYIQFFAAWHFTGSYVLIILLHACTMQLFCFLFNVLIVLYLYLSCIVLKVFCHFALLRFRERQEVSAAEAARFAVEMGLAPVSQIHMLKNLESESYDCRMSMSHRVIKSPLLFSFAWGQRSLSEHFRKVVCKWSLASKRFSSHDLFSILARCSKLCNSDAPRCNSVPCKNMQKSHYSDHKSILMHLALWYHRYSLIFFDILSGFISGLIAVFSLLTTLWGDQETPHEFWWDSLPRHTLGKACLPALSKAKSTRLKRRGWSLREENRRLAEDLFELHMSPAACHNNMPNECIYQVRQVNLDDYGHGASYIHKMT